MAPSFSDILEDTRLSIRSLIEYGESLFIPTVRLGVTGLSRAGKTVFITALVHGLLRGGRFPVFESLATGRIARARLEPQPDDAVPLFAYEGHVRTLIEDRRWPHSTGRPCMRRSLPSCTRSAASGCSSSRLCRPTWPSSSPPCACLECATVTCDTIGHELQCWARPGSCARVIGKIPERTTGLWSAREQTRSQRLTNA